VAKTTVLDDDDRFETARLEMAGESRHPTRIRGYPGGDRCDHAELQDVHG